MSKDPREPDSGDSPDTVSAAATDWAERERKAQEARQRERAELGDLLRVKGVERVEAGYDGYGDSGNMTGSMHRKRMKRFRSIEPCGITASESLRRSGHLAARSSIPTGGKCLSALSRNSTCVKIVDEFRLYRIG